MKSTSTLDLLLLALPEPEDDDDALAVPMGSQQLKHEGEGGQGDQLDVQELQMALDHAFEVAAKGDDDTGPVPLPPAQQPETGETGATANMSPPEQIPSADTGSSSAQAAEMTGSENTELGPSQEPVHQQPKTKDTPHQDDTPQEPVPDVQEQVHQPTAETKDMPKTAETKDTPQEPEEQAHQPKTAEPQDTPQEPEVQQPKTSEPKDTPQEPEPVQEPETVEPKDTPQEPVQQPTADMEKTKETLLDHPEETADSKCKKKDDSSGSGANTLEGGHFPVKQQKYFLFTTFQFLVFGQTWRVRGRSCSWFGAGEVEAASAGLPSELPEPEHKSKRPKAAAAKAASKAVASAPTTSKASQKAKAKPKTSPTETENEKKRKPAGKAASAPVKSQKIDSLFQKKK